jgi:hypothetical protein
MTSKREGSNIHYGPSGKPLCSYSKRVCQQRRMEDFAYCVKHILEDSKAPFRQCSFICKQVI